MALYHLASLGYLPQKNRPEVGYTLASFTLLRLWRHNRSAITGEPGEIYIQLRFPGSRGYFNA